MRKLSFKKSSVATIGMELECQLIDLHHYTLISKAKELIRTIKASPYKTRIKPEITQSMIEINSSIHHSPQTMLDELYELQGYLLAQAANLQITLCGGGSHPFQTWSMQKIYPSLRNKNILWKYRYLSKLATVFGLHIHVGCGNGEDAIYLTHALARYVPQFIAMTASSPFYQGINTGFCSSRSTIFNAFPSSGVMPYLTDWTQFSDYFRKMRHLGIAVTMKDLYWDIRPKPEFGTVEIRVCDTPLTIKKAILIAAYIQSLAIYLLEERPTQVCHDVYYLYGQNRFEASRYGFEGSFINPYTLTSCSILEDILDTAKQIEKYINQLGNTTFVTQLLNDVINGKNDTSTLIELFKQENSLHQVVKHQCKLWSEVIK